MMTSLLHRGICTQLIEHGLMSAQTQYRLYGRQFCRSKDPTNSIKVLKEATKDKAKERKQQNTHMQTIIYTQNKHNKSPSLQ